MSLATDTLARFMKENGGRPVPPDDYLWLGPILGGVQFNVPESEDSKKRRKEIDEEEIDEDESDENESDENERDEDESDEGEVLDDGEEPCEQLLLVEVDESYLPFKDTYDKVVSKKFIVGKKYSCLTHSGGIHEFDIFVATDNELEAVMAVIEILKDVSERN